MSLSSTSLAASVLHPSSSDALPNIPRPSPYLAEPRTQDVETMSTEIWHSSGDLQRDLSVLEMEVPNQPKESERVFKNRWHEMAFVFVVVLAQLFTQLNLGNTIVQLRSISEDIGASDSAAQESWFVASYSTTVGAFVVATGRLGDIYGIKKLFLVGWIWLCVLSLLCGFAPKMSSSSPVIFDVLRALLGIGAATLMPNASALLGTAFSPGPKKNTAFALFGAVAPGGFVLGILWGALFGQLANDWRWAFWGEAALCAATAFAVWFLVPDKLDVKHGGSFDWLGSVIGISALVLIFFSFNAAPLFGWSTAYVPSLLGVGVLLLVLFVLVENRVSSPVMPMSMFTHPAFSAVIVSLACGWMSFGMFQYYTPQFLLRLRSVTPLELTAQLTPCATNGALAAAMAVYLLPRVPAWVVFLCSMIFFCIAQVMFALAPVDQTYWAMTFPTVFIVSIGPDLSFASASLIVSDQVSAQQQGAAGSFVNTVVNYSIGLGLAIAGNLESSVNDGGEELLKGYRAAWWLGAGFAGVGVVVTLLFRGKMQRHKQE